MNRLRRALVSLLAVASLAGAPLACDGSNDGRQPPVSGNPDGGKPDREDPDGGDPTGEGCARERAERHSTRVPESYTPEAAARVIVMGDSISAGVGVSLASTSYANLLLENDATAWPDAEGVDLTSYFGPGLEFRNFAVSGATTTTLLTNQLPSVQSAYAGGAEGMTLAFITIGGNDVQAEIANFFNRDFTGPRLTTALDNIRTVVTALQDEALFPDGVRIYLTNVYDPSDGVGQVNGCFASLDLRDASIGLEVWR